MIGQTIDNYKILDRLESKELYSIYLAEDTIFNKNVSLKVLSHKMADGVEIKRDYISAAQQYLKLNHPHVLKALKVNDTEGFTYISYQEFSHKNLQNYLSENPNMSVKDKLDLFFQVCSAVDYAHQYCVLHKNITADNIFVDPHGRAKLANFGTSFVELLHTEIHHTQILDDFYYFPPEKINKEPLDERSDLYCLGVLLFYILSRKYPFDGDNLDAVFSAKVEGRKRDIEMAGGHEKDVIAAVINKLLSVNKADRYGSVKEILHDLNTGLGTNYTITLSSKQANWFINKGRELYTARQIDQSIENWQKALELDPYNPNIHINLARIYLELENYEKSAEYYGKALELSPLQYKWRLELAGAYKKNKQYDRAIKEYELVRKIEKKFIGFYFNYGNCLFMQNKYAEAVSVWEEGLKSDQDKTKFFYNIGVAKYRLKAVDEAFSQWDQIIKANNKFVRAIYNISIVEINKGNYDKAVALWNDVDKISGIADIKLNLGNYYCRSGNFESALAHWQEALKLNEKCWQAYFNLGVYYFDKDKNRAKEMFEKAIAVEPDCWQSWWNFGYIIKENGDPGNAFTYFDKVMQLNPSYWQVNYYMGEKSISENDFEKAQKYFLNIMNDKADISDDFYKGIGVIFYKGNKIDKAVDCWAKSVAYHNFQWDKNSQDIPETIYEASRILVDKELKEKGEESEFLTSDGIKFSLKPELELIDCKEINSIIDY